MSERQNKPSASSMERYQLCPGSWSAEQGIPEETSADAEMGNRIHAVLAGETVTPPLTDDEERTMEACRSRADALLDAILPHRDEMHMERRYWWGKQWSGKPDVVAVDCAFAEGLIIDYKTGRGDVASAEGNMQLRALAILVAVEHQLEKVTVAIVQPLVGEVSTCAYDARHLKQARLEICGIIDGIQKPDAPRNPSSKACKYCKAKAQCPEALALAESAPLAVSRDGRELVISPERIAEFLGQIPAIEAVVEAVKAKARRILEDGGTVPGYTLKPGAERETITDPTTVFNRAAAAGVKSEAFMGCVSVTKTKLKDAVKAATGEKGKALDARMESILAGCTETKAAAPSLAKVKEVA